VEDIDVEFFSQLDSGDLLFIDSSHTVKIGGDVNYLFLEVLPRLKPGVIVHVHDIFLLFDYRRDWVTEEFRFWTEQYFLHAFLTLIPSAKCSWAIAISASITWKISKRRFRFHRSGADVVSGCADDWK
jgi:hypothetical protein